MLDEDDYELLEDNNISIQRPKVVVLNFDNVAPYYLFLSICYHLSRGARSLRGLKKLEGTIWSHLGFQMMKIL